MSSSSSVTPAPPAAAPSRSPRKGGVVEKLREDASSAKEEEQQSSKSSTADVADGDGGVPGRRPLGPGSPVLETQVCVCPEPVKEAATTTVPKRTSRLLESTHTSPLEGATKERMSEVAAVEPRENSKDGDEDAQAGHQVTSLQCIAVHAQIMKHWAGVLPGITSVAHLGEARAQLEGLDNEMLVDLICKMAATIAEAVPVPGDSAEQANFISVNSPQTQGTVSTTSGASFTPTKFTDKALRVTDDEGFTTLNNYILLDEIGRGKFGVVRMAMLSDTGEARAIKVIPHKNLRASKWFALGGRSDDSRAIQREVAVMKKLRHRNIVPLYEVIDDPECKHLFLVMKHVENGSLVHMNDDGTCPPIDIDIVRGYMRQIVAGLGYLHRHHIVHRDIKPDNILLGADGVVYISDFGISKIFREDDKLSGADGTPSFAAPEMIRGGEFHGRPTDMWALGVTLYSLVMGKLPFRADNIVDLNKLIAAGEVDYSPPEHIDYCCNDGISLLSGLLTNDPEKRLTIEEAAAHPFLTKGKLRHRKALDDAGAMEESGSINITEEEIDHGVCEKNQGQTDRCFLQACQKRQSMRSMTVRHGKGRGGNGELLSVSTASNVILRTPHLKVSQ